MKATIDANRKYSGDKMKKQDSKPDKLTKMVKNMMDRIQISNSSPEKKYPSKAQDTNTTFPAKKKSPQLEGVYYTKIGGMWNLKHETRSPKFYELLIKTEIKYVTVLDLRNFYNHIKICINEMTRMLNSPSKYNMSLNNT